MLHRVFWLLGISFHSQLPVRLGACNESTGEVSQENLKNLGEIPSEINQTFLAVGNLFQTSLYTNQHPCVFFLRPNKKMQRLKGRAVVHGQKRTREGQNLFASHVEVESLGGEGLRVVVSVETNLTEGTGWITKERKVRSPGWAHSRVVIRSTAVSPAFEAGGILMEDGRCLLAILCFGKEM